MALDHNETKRYFGNFAWSVTILVSPIPRCVCQKVKGQVNEMREKISLKIDVKCAASFNKGDNFPQILYVIMSKISENELQFR